MIKVTNLAQTQIGNKAYHAYLMQQAGLNVPPFAVFRFDFFSDQAALEALRTFQQQFDRHQLNLSELSQALVAWAKKRFTGENLESVQAFLDAYDNNDQFAIRSSASLEDQADTSFAGQFQTQLNVTANEIPQAILNTLQSMYQPAALNYVLTHQIDLERLEMVIMLQEMIDSELSGVYFTANPQGVLNEHVIVSGYGVGSGVVEDKVPTSMTVLHPSMDESKAIQVNLDTAYTETSPGAPQLSLEHMTALTHMAFKVESLLGKYLDIEFAFFENTLYVLQARPITTLPQAPIFILDNSNIVESYPGVSSPLTVSFVKEAYRQVFRGLAKRVLKQSDSQIEAYEPTFANMLAEVNGRIYYQIQNWYQLLQLLPFSKKIIPIWQEMLGVHHLEVPLMPVHLTWRDKGRVMLGIIKAFVNSPKAMDQLEDDFQQIQQRFKANYRPSANLSELRRLFDEIKVAILEQWDITLVNDLYAFIYTALLNKATANQGVQAEIAGITQIESMKPMLSLNEIVKALREDENKAYQDRLFALKNDDIRDFLNKDSHKVTLMIRDFIDSYGDRAPGELKLETTTFRSQPSKLVKLLQKRLDNDLVKDIDDDSEAVVDNNKLNFMARFFKKQALKGIKNRESSRMNRTRIYGMVRTIFLTIGQRFVEAQWMDTVSDIYYLTMEEIFAMVDSGDAVKNLPQLIAERKYQMAIDKQLPAFNRLVYVGEIFNRHPVNIQGFDAEINAATILQGIGCSAGVVQAEVLVIEDLEKVNDFDSQGKIIVTRMTDPGWVYLLTSAKGIIAEKGSLLSHTAIISRELGIPSIVNVASVTRSLKTGDWVEMNGLTGQIRRLEKE